MKTGRPRNIKKIMRVRQQYALRKVLKKTIREIAADNGTSIGGVYRALSYPQKELDAVTESGNI